MKAPKPKDAEEAEDEDEEGEELDEFGKVPSLARCPPPPRLRSAGENYAQPRVPRRA